MATYKKGNDWYIDYRERGRRKREKVGPNHRLAVELLQKRKVEMAEQKFFPERQILKRSFDEQCSKFWRLHGQSMKSPSWKNMMPRIVARFMGRMLADIKATEIQEFYNELLVDSGQNGSPANANRYRTLLLLIFNKAKLWGDFFGDNPVKAVTRKKEDNERTRYLEPEEMVRLLEAADVETRSVLLIAILTGMRRGELLRLDWKHVMFSAGVIRVVKTKAEKPRSIPISPKLKEVLETLGPRSQGLVINLGKAALRSRFDRARTRAGLVDFKFHDTRHTFASYFAMKTRDMLTLQRVLGHATPAMTGRYAHLADEHIAAQMASMDSIIPVISGKSLDGHPDGHQV